MTRPNPYLTRAQAALRSILWYGDTASRPQIPALTPAEWAEVLYEARRHGVAPLLHHRLQRLSPAPAIPPPVKADLQKAYFFNAVINRRRFHYLGQALRALSTARVPVIILKGAYLAEAVYGNIALRVMGDIDLLVRRQDLAKAAPALESAAFAPRERYLDAPDDANEFHFVHRAARAIIDLHWEIINPKFPFALKTDEVWSRARTARVAGADVLALSPEDLMLHLSIHAAMHSFKKGLKAVCDAAEICTRFSVDWAKLSERAAASGATRATWLLPALTRSLLGRPLTEAAVSSSTPSLDDARLSIAAHNIFHSRPSKIVGAGEMLFWGRKSLSDKIRLVAQRAFPSRRRLAGVYPCRPDSMLIYLFYPLWVSSFLQRTFLALWSGMTAPAKRGSSSLSRKETADFMNWLIPPSVPGERNF